MHISAVDIGNIRGKAGDDLRSLDHFWTHTNGVFRPDMPLFNRQLWYEGKADGEHIPKMGYLGRKSFIREIMAGQFGDDYSSSIRNQDPRFDRSVAAGFVPAAEGHTVAERIEIEVTPPGFIKPFYVEYYRLIRRFQWLPGRGQLQARSLLSVLVVPTDQWLFEHSIERHHETTSRTRN